MERRSIAIRGIVQGVGFRPFIYRLASRFELGGFVQNRTDGVCVEVEGDCRKLDEFVTQITAEAPPIARIDDVQWKSQVVRGEAVFRIAPSEHRPGAEVVIAPDVATCDDCLAEMFDPSDRRYRYPFLNCTNCGPRLTIVTGVPYDRHRTTMAKFAMCPACQAEYEDPANRRFHAQPTACPLCGPKLTALDSIGQPITEGDPLAKFIEAIRAGKTGALKGLGGYHLVCDARDEAAVTQLRRRKHREEKPFAVMVQTVAAARALCEISDAERHILSSCRRPIVLLRKNHECALAGGIAPGNPFLGLMLPYTPLHHLLLNDMAGAVLVMTSGNRSEEPIAYDDTDAVQRLAGIADIFLTHDRAIHVRCDDSVTRVIGGFESPVRRSRGYAPAPMTMPVRCASPILAVGGQLKATFALARQDRVILSHHAGDLDDYEAYRAYEHDIAHYEKLFGIQPAFIAHDMHPNYASTRYALRRAASEAIPTIAVQHHHAHLASCMAEHGLIGKVIGVTFDGTGYGTDGNVWGGEFLVGGYDEFHRAAHLRNVPMPGGDRAIREPWRMAISYLLDAGLAIEPATKRVSAQETRTVVRMIERRFNSPLTSSAGRLFDAVAAIIGVRDVVAHEGQAAMELEWLATQSTPCGTYAIELEHVSDCSHGAGNEGFSRRAGFIPPSAYPRSERRDESRPTNASAALSDIGSDVKGGPLFEVDLRPLITAVVVDAAKAVNSAVIARRFHSTMSDMIVEVCVRLRRASGLDRVVLTGGVFMNALLATDVSRRLSEAAFHVYRHRLVPPGDGGLSLGQIAVAAAKSNLGGKT